MDSHQLPLSLRERVKGEGPLWETTAWMQKVEHAGSVCRGNDDCMDAGGRATHGAVAEGEGKGEARRGVNIHLNEVY